MFPGHIRYDGDVRVCQSAQEHCRNAARYAADSASSADFRKTAYLAALCHDMGKFKDEFRRYLEAAARGEKVARGSVNHTFCGARYILETFHQFEDNRQYASELIAYAIGAHHGLFDCMDEFHRCGFDYRRSKRGIAYEESLANFLSECASEEEISSLMSEAAAEFGRFVEKVNGQLLLGSSDPADANCYLGLAARLLTSAVVEGDRRDTAEFTYAVEYPTWPRPQLWDSCLAFANEKHDSLRKGAPCTGINDAREEVFRQCAENGKLPGGVYRLNVPTGGGKTLSALQYALRQALYNDKNRIIFVFPLLSILDQNAKVIRRNLPPSTQVLEHHSNVVQEESVGSDELSDRELLTDSWCSPIIITTLVQLLNTLFSGKMSCVRRFQSLCNSVIVIDEAQTVPLNMLSLFNMAVNFLSTICGATVVLCSATQPCLEETRHPLLHSSDLLPYNEELWDVFKRTVIEDGGRMPFEDISDFAFSVLNETQSLLVVCNKKQQAAALFSAMKHADVVCFHVSASMCQAHRKDVLDSLAAALVESRDGGRKVICVSTQVMEAGVDLSFGRVIRLAAGLDSIVQAAGRENRNGESPEPVPAYIVSCQGEDLSYLNEIRMAKEATENVLASFRKSRDLFDGDLASGKALKSYYRNLYGALPGGYQDFYASELSASLFDLLSSNEKYAEDGVRPPYLLNQAFKTAGDHFRVFDDDTIDVIVPYGPAGERLIADFGSEEAKYDFSRQKKLLEAAKLYSISLMRHQATTLRDKGALVEKCDGLVMALSPDFYDQECGLVMNPHESTFLGV